MNIASGEANDPIAQLEPRLVGGRVEDDPSESYVLLLPANPQPVGQVESTSIIENPRPSSWYSNALFIAFLARRTCFGEWTETLAI